MRCASTAEGLLHVGAHTMIRSVSMGSTNERPLAEVRFYTVAEVAKVMRVSKMTVYRLVHNGELPAVQVGRSFRIPEQAVHAYLQESFVEAG